MDNFIFISIPKTGTNTLIDILKTSKYTHYKAIDIRNILGFKIYNLKQTFCFIRNPHDLIKSWYYYHKFSHRVGQDVRDFYPDTIHEWVFTMDFKTHWELKTHKKNNPLWDLSNPLYQRNYLIDENNKIIVKSVYNFDNITTILQKMFNLTEIPCLNKSVKNNDLSEEIKQRIKKKFAEDFILYESLMT
jgi:hypothetical protein